jgi:hypothetical protein
MEADALNRQYEHIKIKNTSFFYLDFILRKFNITLHGVLFITNWCQVKMLYVCFINET